MMLHLLIGTDWTANRHEVLTRLAGDVARRRPNRILMVPELISHETERALCAAAGDTASRYACLAAASSPRSSTRGRCPARAKISAANIPAGPKPTTTGRFSGAGQGLGGW